MFELSYHTESVFNVVRFSLISLGNSSLLTRNDILGTDKQEGVYS